MSLVRHLIGNEVVIEAVRLLTIRYPLALLLPLLCNEFTRSKGNIKLRLFDGFLALFDAIGLNTSSL
jgi:hypothetical protein